MNTEEEATTQEALLKDLASYAHGQYDEGIASWAVDDAFEKVVRDWLSSRSLSVVSVKRKPCVLTSVSKWGDGWIIGIAADGKKVDVRFGHLYSKRFSVRIAQVLLLDEDNSLVQNAEDASSYVVALNGVREVLVIPQEIFDEAAARDVERTAAKANAPVRAGYRKNDEGLIEITIDGKTILAREVGA